MIEFIFLVAIIGGIVALSRRWPDIEARLFSGHAPVSKQYASEHPDFKPEKPDAQPEPVPTAGGVMQKRPIMTEPDVDPAALHGESAAATAPTADSDSSASSAGTDADERAETAADPDTQPAVEASVAAEPPVSSSDTAEPGVSHADDPLTAALSDVTDEADSKVESDLAAATDDSPTPAPVSSEPVRVTPGEFVTGQPARPSQPAYFDATNGTRESIDDLAAEADQAYRDRDYQRAEQACLKILVQEPKNHKYMTRIGQVYQEMGQLDDAREAYEAAKALDPKNFFVLNRLTEVERLLTDKGGRTKSTDR